MSTRLCGALLADVCAQSYPWQTSSYPSLLRCASFRLHVSLRSKLTPPQARFSNWLATYAFSFSSPSLPVRNTDEIISGPNASSTASSAHASSSHSSATAKPTFSANAPNNTSAALISSSRLSSRRPIASLAPYPRLCGRRVMTTSVMVS